MMAGMSSWRLDGERWLIGAYDTAAEARSVCERHREGECGT